MKILLIEDNVLNQKVVMFNLKKFNFDIAAFTNGMEALESIKETSYDLILMDIMLPEMNGYQVTSEIRKFEEENNIETPVPIIALTANTYDNDRERCLNAGMNEYLAKPFTSEQLVEVIKKFISTE